MKKIGLLTTLLVAGLLLTGCNKLNSEIDEIRALELAKTKEGRIELCNNKILAEVDSGATNFVGEEIIYSEGDEDSRHSDNFIYFNGSNGENKVYGCGLVRYGKFINLYPVDQDFLNSEEYQQLGELRKMLTVKDEEPVSEESEIGKNSINLGEELLGNEEGVIFEPKKWKGQMPCIGGCDNGKDTEYVEGWYYEYVNPSLGIKITTPDGENGNWNNIFLEKRETPLFLLSGNSIYSLEYVRDNEELKFAEYIKGYKKDSLMSLEELLDKTYSSSGCNLRKYDINQNLGTHFKGAGEYYYEFVSNDGNVYNDCAGEDGENGVGPIIFIESKDGEKFYKVSIGDGCAPGPCSIFGKIELL